MDILKKKTGMIMVTVLSLIPVLLWVFAEPVASRFSSLNQFFLSLGQVSGLVGTVLFALTLILSARLKILERFFGGLNQVYERHSQLGQLALILILFHPLLLLPQYSASWNDAMAFFLLSTNWAQNWGILSLGLMIVLITLTLYLRPRYDLWKWTHKLLGLAFFLGALHVWMVPSNTFRFLPLRVYVLGLSVIGLGAFLYRTVFSCFLVKKLRYAVSDIQKLNETITEISLKPLGALLAFKAGQFLFIQFPGSALGSEAHPFSIVSGPDESILRLGVKTLGDYTSSLDELKVGDIALIEGPYGNFTMDHTNYKNQIWVAGGIGITPLISLANFLPQGQGYNIDLFYCVKNENESAYIRNLEILSQANPFFKVHLFCSEQNGRIDADYIQNVSKFLSNKDILICAPLPMIRSLKQQFAEKDIPESLIHSEEFNF